VLVAIGLTWVSVRSWRANHVVDAPRWWRRVVLGAALIAGVGVATLVPWPDSVDLGAIAVITGTILICSGLVLGAMYRRPTA
jgi:hypothetical protein